MIATEDAEHTIQFENGEHLDDSSNEILSENIERNLLWQVACTGEEDKTCQIVDHLPSLNKLLGSIGLRLRELSDGDGQLAVVDSGFPGFTSSHEQGRRQAFGFLSWLLKSHTCVTSLYVNEAFLQEFQEGVLQGVFDGNSSLKSLKVDSTFYTYRDSDTKGVSKIISSIAQLEALEVLSYDLHIELAEVISEALRTNMLTVLDLSVRACTCDDAFDSFMAALKENLTLRELSVSDGLCTNISARDGKAFSEYLEQNSVLDKLNVHANACHIMQCTLTGMCSNRSVSKLSLFGEGVGDRVYWLLRDMFFHNTVLRSFTIADVADYFVFRDCEGFDECLRSLAGNSEMQYVKLPFTMIPRGGWSSLFETVSNHRSLKEFIVQLSEEEYDKVLALEGYGLHCGIHEYLLEVCKCLENSPAKHRVKFTFEALDPHICTLDGTPPVDLVPLAERGITSTPMNLLRQFCSFGSCQVTQLRLELSRLKGHSMDVAQFIEETTTLQKLCLIGNMTRDLPAIDSIWSTISESLSQNTSIREVEVTVYAEGERAENLKHLLDVVQFSKTIRRLSVNSSQSSDLRLRNVDSLPTEVSKNYTLCSFRLSHCRRMTPDSVWFSWYNTAWRNSGIVARAAAYVKLTRCDGRCARALETVSRHPALMEELAEVLTVSEAVVAHMVKTRLSHIQDMHAFMRMAGVVQDRVTCHPHENGLKQLQDLNESMKEFIVQLSEKEYDKVLVLKGYGLHSGIHEYLLEVCKCLENSPAKHR
ncbi:hypothetical protein MTO96_030162, partial [Rhipicephalus appendiculatus]